MICSPCHATRNASLSSYLEMLRVQRDADVSRLNASITACHAQHDQEAIEAGKIADAETIALEWKLAADAQDGLRPLFAVFRASPTRDVAGQARDEYRKLNERALFELGEGLAPQVAGIALGAAYGLAARMADPYYFRFTGTNPAPYKIADMIAAFLENQPDVVCEGRIVEAERAISARGTLDHENPARLEVLLSRASNSGMRNVLGAFDVPPGPGYGDTLNDHCHTNASGDNDPSGQLAITRMRQRTGQSLGR